MYIYICQFICRNLNFKICHLSLLAFLQLDEISRTFNKLYLNSHRCHAMLCILDPQYCFHQICGLCTILWRMDLFVHQTPWKHSTEDGKF